MKNMVLSMAFIFLFLTACATLMGKWSASKIDKLSDQCIVENEGLKPSTSKWYNLSTQERTKKKKELDDYRKKRIELYQSLYNFKTRYLAHTDNDGVCRKSECKPLERLRSLIAAGCPATGESFPIFDTDKQ